jgi:uncharacterized protein (TIGR02246 family)
MLRQLALCTLTTFGCIGLAVADVASTPDSRDEATVVAIPQGFADAWNRHDMDAMAALFAVDADFVNVIGQRWIGRQEIKRAHAAAHAAIFRKSHLVVRHTSVRFLTPDVAVIRFQCKLTGEVDGAGHEQPPRYTLPTFIATRSAEGWLIAVAQNTNINTTLSPVDF